MTRIQLDTGYIELGNDIDFPITLAFADVTENGSRSGGWSKMIDVHSTPNNERIIGRYFDVDLTNLNFDRNKKNTCTVIQNDTEVFTGFVQLVEVNRVNKGKATNNKTVTYKINVFDEVSNFFLSMGDKDLTDLDFSDLAHTFNRTEIISSWDNTEGYVYPMFAKDHPIYTLRDFKPAIFELEYWKRIFQTNGYSYTFGQIASDSIRFDKRIIPFNGKESDDDIKAELVDKFTVRGEDELKEFTMLTGGVITLPLGFTTPYDYVPGSILRILTNEYSSKIQLDSVFQDSQDQYDNITTFTNKAGTGRTWNFLTSYDYSIDVRAKDEAGNVTPWRAQRQTNGWCELAVTLIAQSLTDSNKRVIIDAGTSARTFLGTNATETFATGYQLLGTGSNSSVANLGLFNENETFDITALVLARYYNTDGTLVSNEVYQSLGTGGDNNLLQLPIIFLGETGFTPRRLEFNVQITTLQFKASPDIQEFVAGVDINPSLFVPKKIKQKDLISSIAKSYNLVFVPDPNNDRNIIVKTRDKYYDDGIEWDWTDKLDEGQDNSIKFLNNSVNRVQRYRYKGDKDTINSAYQDEFNRTFGETQITLDNEYTNGEDVRELIYSPTPNVMSGIGVTLPSIDGITPQNNVRVLLYNGKKTGTSYQFFNDITVENESALAYVNTYPATSMFNDDERPNFSLCFDSPKALFHATQLGQTSNYLYNLHHKRELTTINKGKMLVGYFNLNEGDFAKLSKRLDWKIFIKNNGWFYISKVSNYNGVKRTLTQVELVTADDESQIKYIYPIRPITFGTLKPIRDHFGRVNRNTNIIISEKQNFIEGKYNVVVADNVRILGDRNKVLSSDVVVTGNRNTINTGLNGVKVISDDTTPTTIGTYLEGNNIKGDGDVIYKTSITQTGTNDPTNFDIKDTMGGIDWERSAVGVYYGFPRTATFSGEVEVIVTNADQTNTVTAFCDFGNNRIQINTGVDGVLAGAGKNYITIIQH